MTLTWLKKDDEVMLVRFFNDCRVEVFYRILSKGRGYVYVCCHELMKNLTFAGAATTIDEAKQAVNKVVSGGGHRVLDIDEYICEVIIDED